jgi:hypothetical protein
MADQIRQTNTPSQWLQWQAVDAQSIATIHMEVCLIGDDILSVTYRDHVRDRDQIVEGYSIYFNVSNCWWNQ